MAAYFIAFHIIRRKRKRNRLSQKIIKDLQDPFNLDEDTFKKKFSLNQNGVHYLHDLLGPIMKRNRGYPVELQILASLQVLTSGSFQSTVAEDQILHVSQATVSRSLDAFLEAILEVEQKLIEFPSLSELAFAEPTFYGESKIPNVIGVIDCVPVLIHKPRGTDAAIYLNKYEGYSINVQLVCQSDQYIIDAVTHWPGSSPVSLIWKHSSLRQFLKENIRPNRYYLLGNGSFPLEPWLLRPYEDFPYCDELIFNDHVHRALTVVQTCVANIRSRFKCIKSDPLMYNPEKCSKIIMACILLHNICVRLGIEPSEEMDCAPDFLYVPDSSDADFDDEEDISMLRHEAKTIRDEVAKQLIETR